MAEIRVEPRKKSRGWLWLVLLLIVIAAILYYLYASGMLGGGATSPTTPDSPTTTPATPTSMIPGPVPSVASAAGILTSSLIGGSYGSA